MRQPVAIAGVVVLPGDIIVADADGVVVVQRHEVAKRTAYANGLRREMASAPGPVNTISKNAKQ